MAKKANPGPCRFDPSARGAKKLVLCTAMDKYLVGNSWGRRSRGLYMMDNLMHMATGVTTNMGPYYRDGAKDNGVLLNFCPWCGSDLVKNWHEPAIADKEARIAKKTRKKAG